MNIPLLWVKIFLSDKYKLFSRLHKKAEVFIRKSLLVAVDNAITHNILTVGDNLILQEY